MSVITSAGLTAAASVFLALQETEFLSLEEQARQRLTAGLTRSTGPLIVVAPLFRHGLIAAFQMHAHLTGHSRCKSALGGIWQRHAQRAQDPRVLLELLTAPGGNTPPPGFPERLAAE